MIHDLSISAVEEIYEREDELFKLMQDFRKAYEIIAPSL